MTRSSAAPATTRSSAAPATTPSPAAAAATSWWAGRASPAASAPARAPRGAAALPPAASPNEAPAPAARGRQPPLTEPTHGHHLPAVSTLDTLEEPPLSHRPEPPHDPLVTRRGHLPRASDLGTRG